MKFAMFASAFVVIILVAAMLGAVLYLVDVIKFLWWVAKEVKKK